MMSDDHIGWLITCLVHFLGLKNIVQRLLMILYHTKTSLLQVSICFSIF